MLASLVAGTFSHGQRVAVPCRLKNSLAALMLAGVGFGAFALVFPAPAFAQATGKPLTLKEAAQNAVLNNPEVLARWHTIKAADGERDVGAGALLPKVDLAAGSGAERRSTPTTVGTRFDRNSASLTITQLLVRRFCHAQRRQAA